MGNNKNGGAAFWGTMFFSGLILGPAGTYGAFIIFLLQNLTKYFDEYYYNGGVFLPIASFILGFLMIPGTIEFLREKYGKTKRHTGKMTDTDFNEINIDEAHGMAVAGIPVFFIQLSFLSALMWLGFAFALFRFFDIKKPFGIKAFEKKMSEKSENLQWQSLIVMLDDTIAGLYSAICVTVGIYFFN